MERSADSAASPLNGQRISPTGPGPGQISPGLRLLSARSQLMPTSLLPQNGSKFCFYSISSLSQNFALHNLIANKLKTIINSMSGNAYLSTNYRFFEDNNKC